MKYFAILDQDNDCLAYHECCSVLQSKSQKQQKNVVLFDAITTTYVHRLTYTKLVCKIVMQTSINTLYDKLGNLQSSHIITSKDKADKRISTAACKKAVQKNTKAPKHCVLIINQQCYVGQILFENDKSFLQRHPQKRPAHHPATIHPKLARATVNLCGIQEGTIYDPLCGIGGIPIEAAILGFKTIGSDIDQIMLKKAQTNIEHYKKLYKYQIKIKQQDATITSLKADAIITDLPYARTTKKIDDLQTFYTKCLKHFSTLTDTALIMFPDFTPNKKIIKNSGWKIQTQCSYYLHRSLSKEMYLLNKK